MRIFNVQQIARPLPVDRQGSNKTIIQSQTAISPHAFTTRSTYTVPAGKKAQVQIVVTFVQRITAAAPVGQAQSSALYTPSGGSQGTFHTAIIITNGVNDFQFPVPEPFGDMLAGDAFAVGDVDTSTGGTVTFAENAKIFEYAA